MIDDLRDGKIDVADGARAARGAHLAAKVANSDKSAANCGENG